MSIRFTLITTFVLLALFFNLASAIPPPIHVTMSTTCDGDAMQVQVWVENWIEETIYLTVKRTESAPDMLGESILVESLAVPSENQPFGIVLPDPGIGPEDLGFYEAMVFLSDGSEYTVFTEQLSCTEEPYLMRGWLVSDSIFQPCAGLGLLECEEVTLLYGDMNEFVGTGELLEIHGWLNYLEARDECEVIVTAIESLGAGAACEDVVALSPSSWDAVKARYR